jgi:hypothetical protein
MDKRARGETVLAELKLVRRNYGNRFHALFYSHLYVSAGALIKRTIFFTYGLSCSFYEPWSQPHAPL